MSDTLRLHLDSAAALAPERGGVAGLPSAERLAATGRIEVLVPAEAVLLTRVALPAGSAARLAQALPWALEDQVLDDVDRLHFAAAPRAADGTSLVAVVARERIEDWLAALARAGVRADALLPDVCALPVPETGHIAFVDGTRCRVRAADGSGYACALAEASHWLGAGAEVPVWLAPGVSPQLLPAGCAWAVQSGPRPEPRGVPPLNLLSGAYAPRHRRRRQRRLWRVAAVLAAAALLLAGLTRVTSVVRLQAANAAAEASLQTHYAELFPGSPPVPDPVARVRSELQRLGGAEGVDGAGLLGLLDHAGPILASHDRQLELRGMEYRNAALELAVHAPDLANLDQLRERLATLPGLHVTLSAATQTADGVDGRLHLTGAGR